MLTLSESTSVEKALCRKVTVNRASMWQISSSLGASEAMSRRVDPTPRRSHSRSRVGAPPRSAATDCSKQTLGVQGNLWVRHWLPVVNVAPAVLRETCVRCFSDRLWTSCSMDESEFEGLSAECMARCLDEALWCGCLMCSFVCAPASSSDPDEEDWPFDE